MRLRSFFKFPHVSQLATKRWLLGAALLVQAGVAATYLFVEHNWIEAGVVQSLKNVSSLHLRSFEQLETTLNYQLASVAEAVRIAGVNSDSLRTKEVLLSNETKRQWLDTIIVLDPTGKIIALDSQVPVAWVLPPAVLASYSFKDSPQYRFIYDRWIESTSFFISRPFADGLGEGGMVTYRMIKSPDGEPLGSVVGFTSRRTLSVLLNTDAARGFELGKDGVLAILDHNTREVLYRYTYAEDPGEGHKTGLEDIGKSLLKTMSSLAIVDHQASEASRRYSFAGGQAEGQTGQQPSESSRWQTIGSAFFQDTTYGPDVKFYLSPFDGLERLAVLAPLHHGQWLQLVSQSKDEYLFNWRIQMVISVAVFACLAVLQWLLVGVFHQNQLQRKALEYDAMHDVMTGLANRRHFFSWVATVRQQADRYQQPWSVLALDVDHFKKVNDTYGHDAGDVVLCALAAILRANVRDCDIAARFGGEEFIVCLPQTALAGAAIVAERIRLALAEKAITATEREIRCTVSIGIAEYQPQSDLDIDEILKQADGALYRAKASGRNRVELATI